MPVSKQIIN